MRRGRSFRCPSTWYALLLLAWLASPGAFPARGGLGPWTRQGPEGGSPTAIVVDPDSPSTIYLATLEGHVYKSTDTGTSWATASNGLPQRGNDIRALAMDPAGPSTLYVPIFGDGIYKTTDGATTWTSASGNLSGSELYVDSIAVVPGQSGVVYAGTIVGLFKSSNGGATWSPSTNGMGTPWINDLAVSPHQNTTVFAATQTGLYRSLNSGTSWSRMTGIPDSRVESVDCHPGLSWAVFASSRATGGQGIYRSTSGGGGWSLVRSLSEPVFGFAFDVDNTNVVYTAINAIGGGTLGVLKSMDTGVNWSFSGLGLTHPYQVISIAAHPTPGTLFAGQLDEGVHKSSDAGGNWTAHSGGLIDIALSTVRTDPNDPAIIYVGASTTGNEGEGVYKSLDGGVTWDKTGGLTTHVGELAVLPTTPTRIYAAGLYSTFRSDDAGASWSWAGSGLTNGQTRSLVYDPAVLDTLYQATFGGGIFKTTDGGTSWVSVNDGLATLNVGALAIDPDTTDTLYAGTDDGVYKTTDGAATWMLQSSGLNGATVFDLAIDPNTPNVIFASTDAAFFISLDGAQSWSPAGAEPPCTYIRDFAIDPDDANSIFVYCNGAVHCSVDRGATWSGCSDGLTSQALSDLFVDRVARRIYATAVDGGMFQAEILATETATPSPTPTDTPSSTPSATFTSTSTWTVTGTATSTPAPPTSTATATDTPSATATPTSTETIAPTPTDTPLSYVVCPSQPTDACVRALSSRLTLKDAPSDGRDRFAWKLSGAEQLDQSDFGMPNFQTSYVGCLYDDGVLEMELRIPASDNLWRSMSDRGYRYRDRDRSHAGVADVRLLAGDAGRSKAILKAIGEGIPLPNPVESDRLFNATVEVVFQLLAEDAACLESRFLPPDISRNERGILKARF